LFKKSGSATPSPVSSLVDTTLEVDTTPQTTPMDSSTPTRKGKREMIKGLFKKSGSATPSPVSSLVDTTLEVDTTPQTTPMDSSTPTQPSEETDAEVLPSEGLADADVVNSDPDDSYLSAASVTPMASCKSPELDSFEGQSQSQSVPMLSGAIEKVTVYYMQVKNGIMEIVGSVGGKVVFINAKVHEIGSGPIQKLSEASLKAQTAALDYGFKARGLLNDKTVWLQDGYIYTTATVEGQIVYIKAKASEFHELVSERAADCSSKVLACYEAARARGHSAVQPLVPYYVKVQDGVVYVVAPVGKMFVVIQAKTCEIYTSVQVRTLDSLAGARSAIQGYSSPLVSRMACIQLDMKTRIECVTISIKDGVVSVRGAVGKRFIDAQAKISEVLATVSLKASDGIMGTKAAITDLVEKLAAIVSGAYGQALGKARLLSVSVNDGVFYMACQVNDRMVIFKMRVSEVDEYVRSKSMMFYSTAASALADTYCGAKTRLLQATEVTKTKTMEAGANVRSIAANPAARVTMVSAGAGALSLGATGGAAGLMTGGAVGALVSIPAALFTFGLSIPLGAAIGAGAGLCIGSTAGGATGLVSGGAAGYNAHKHKDQIGSKAKAYRDLAAASTSKLRAQVMGTGGFAHA